MAVLRLWGIPQRGALAGAVLVLVLAGLVLAAPGPPTPASAGFASASACPGALGPTSYQGVVADLGGAPGAVSVSDVKLLVDYSIEATVTNLTTGAVESISCSTSSLSTESNATGGFAFGISPGSTSCLAPAGDPELECTTYSGPYGPLAITVENLLPPDYAAVTNETGANVTVDLVALLETLELDPTGPVAVDAPGAALSVAAVPYAADGAPTPAGVGLTYNWSITGSGWSLAAPSNTSSVSVVSALDAGVGHLSVSAATATEDDDTNSPVPLETSPANLTLWVAATGITSSELNRTVLDVGGSVRAQANATGAAGFAYSATFSNGEGGAPISVPCATGASSGGLVNVSCSADLPLPEAGTVVPSVVVTNGFSEAGANFTAVTITPPPQLELTPSAPVGYAGAPIPVELSAAAGTGATPFQGACLATGGAVLCSTSAGPTWTFDPVLADAGVYSATAWAIDADGENASASTTLDVVAPLDLGPISAPSNATVSEPVSLSVDLTGGVLPVAYFFNASTSAAPLAAGTMDSDRPISATFDPSQSGVVQVTVTAVDDLGTRTEVETDLSIAPAPAAVVRAVSATPGSAVVVGTPTSVAWTAFGADGRPVPTYAPSIELTLSGPSGPVAGWVNASGIGPFAAVAPGEFAVPSNAWVNGTLQVSVTGAAAVATAVDLVGTGLPGAVAPWSFAVAPDLDHLELSQPDVVVPGARTNATEWTVTDRFGDPVPGAPVTIEVDTASGGLARVAPAVVGAGGLTYVWVNVSLGASGGSVRVLDAAGDLLLPARSVPALTAPAAGRLPPLASLGATIPIGIVAGSLSYAAARRRRRSSPPPLEEAMRQLSEGRARIEEIVDATGGATLSELARVWDPPPAPPELAEWVASLVTDGTLAPTESVAGETLYRLAPREEGVRITLDPEELERAIARRAEETEPEG